MQKSTFDRKLQAFDPTLFIERDRPPKREEEVRDALRPEQREERWMIKQRVPRTGEVKVVHVIETEDGKYREPSDIDLNWAREMNHCMLRLWNNPDSKFLLENWCYENLDKEKIQSVEKLQEVWSEILRGPMHEHIRSIYQHQYRTLFGGKTYHTMSLKGRHHVQNWRR